MGDENDVLPSNEKAKVSSIFITDRESLSAKDGQPVTIQLDREVDITRGCVLSEKCVLVQFTSHRMLGSFVLIDRVTNTTSACGVIEHPLRRLILSNSCILQSVTNVEDVDFTSLEKRTALLFWEELGHQKTGYVGINAAGCEGGVLHE